MKLRDRERDQTYHFVVGKRPEVLCEMKKKKEKDGEYSRGRDPYFWGGKKVSKMRERREI